MSQDSEAGDLYRRLLKGFSKSPDRSVMNEEELKANEMATDAKIELNKIFPKDPKHGFVPVQWAVRTSMQEIGNSTALNSLVSELDPDTLHDLSEKTGMSINWLRNHYKELGDRLDVGSVFGAYTIIECNITEDSVRDPVLVAGRFIRMLDNLVSKHEPDIEDVETDSITPLSNGHRTPGGETLFEGKYTFRNS